MRTTEVNATPEKPSVSRNWPWWIGGVALLLYWVTLSPWLSLNNLATVARMCQWPEGGASERLLALVLWTPFRWLPAAWLPLTLNVVTALVAALVLVQLARSVSILRLDVVAADPMRQKVPDHSLFTGSWAWLPPVFAAVALGLQLGFWEHATSASGEIFGVLCFAYAFRCVLEFRLVPREAWLYRGTFVYALGVTDNWLMLGYLPVFMAALIWVKGFSPCLRWRFLWRISLGGLLGLSLYLLAPLAAGGGGEFGASLQAYLAGQKHALGLLRTPALRLLALTAVLPFLLLAVRWRSHSVKLADDTNLGVLVTKASGHFIHALFLATSLWITLNPAFAPHPGKFHAVWLVYYYAWALAAGYGIAYVLLFSLPSARKGAARWPLAVAGFLLVALAAVLGGKNFGSVRLTNSSALKEFAAQLYEDLPAHPVTVLSDEPLPLQLLRAELLVRPTERPPLLVDTRALPDGKYRERLAHDYGARWPAGSTSNQMARLNPLELTTLISQLARNETLVYLHPSSGLFFESFVGQPIGWGLRLAPRDSAGPTRRAQAEAAQRRQQHWEATLRRRARQFAEHREQMARWKEGPGKMFRLSGRLNETAQVLGDLYSKALNSWGVDAQKAGPGDEARAWFERALIFNPDNLAARINLAFAERQARGETNRLTWAEVKEAFPKTLAKYQTWPEVIGRNGPVDEPTFLLQSGRMYLGAANPRQALDCFARSAELAPDWALPQLWQAQGFNVLGEFARAAELSAALLPQESTLRPPGLVQLLQVHAVALWRLGRTNEATAFVAAFTMRHQAINEVVGAAAEFCAATGDFAQELRWREMLAEREPRRVEWLVKKGHAELRAGKPEAALQTLTTALTLAPGHANARLFRAVAALRLGKLADARHDYTELLQHPTQTQRALFGLGGIAWRQHDTNAMIQYYQAFLTNSAAAAAQSAVALERLKEWQEE